MPSISDLLASISKHGLASSSRFLVSLTPPSKVLSLNSQMLTFGRDLQLMCSRASIPGVTLDTEEHRHYDLSVKTVKGKNFAGNIDLTLRVDKSFKVLQYFHNWMHMAYDPETGDVGWYDDYVGKVIIYLLDRTDISVFKVSLEEAFPVSTNSIDLSWDTTNSLMDLQVSFAYKRALFEPDNSNMGDKVNATVAALDDSMSMKYDAQKYAESYLKRDLKTSNSGYVPLTGFDNILS